jgi:hypothetical protein
MTQQKEEAAEPELADRAESELGGEELADLEADHAAG